MNVHYTGGPIFKARKPIIIVSMIIIISDEINVAKAI